MKLIPRSLLKSFLTFILFVMMYFGFHIIGGHIGKISGEREVAERITERKESDEKLFETIEYGQQVKNMLKCENIWCDANDFLEYYKVIVGKKQAILPQSIDEQTTLVAYVLDEKTKYLEMRAEIKTDPVQLGQLKTSLDSQQGQHFLKEWLCSDTLQRQLVTFGGVVAVEYHDQSGKRISSADIQESDCNGFGV